MNLQPPNTGRRVTIRPVLGQDYDMLMKAELAQPDGLLYRYRGQTPSPESFVANLWNGVLNQQIIADIRTGQPVGIVAAYNADFRNGTAYLAAFVFPEFRRAGWPLEGVKLFLDYLFFAFPIRKLYAEVLEPNARQFGSATGSLLHEEGRLRSHEYLGGVFVDRLVLALYSEEWASWTSRFDVDDSPLLAAIRARETAGDA
jgi:RimJ/RimL family protein N-acetyltransferase